MLRIQGKSRRGPGGAVSVFVPRSLKGLLLFNEAVFVILLLVMGGIGGVSALQWQRASAQAVRLSSLLVGAQQIRADTYSQVEDVVRARLAEDRDALARVVPQARVIDRRFETLRALADDEDVRRALSYLADAYAVLRRDMDNVFRNPFEISESARLKLLDRAHEEWMLADFESAMTVLSAILAERQRTLRERQSRWTGLASVLVPVPLLLALVLMTTSAFRLRRRFLRPMQALADDVMALREGDLSHRAQVSGVAEVRELATAFNTMAAELERSRDALLASERQAALGALVPVVAHNIRNPLASIRASAQVMEAGDSEAELLETRQAIISSVDQLERWVRALLSYLNPLEPRRTSVSPAQLARAVVDLMQPRLLERGVALEVEGFDHAPSLLLDRDLMEQALYGLVNNAFEASPPGATITLSLESSSQAVSLRIGDRGAGMSVTPKFGDLTPGPSTKPYGTGLGIPFAAKVAQAHAATLEFAQREGGGTLVTWSFPCSREAPA